MRTQAHALILFSFDRARVIGSRRCKFWVALVPLLIAGLLTLPASAQVPGLEGSSPAAGGQGTKLSRSDKSFLRQAAEGNQAAIELGQVAEQKGSSTVARNFARSLVWERRRAQQQLLTLAHALNFALPLKLSRHDRKAKRQLEKHSGQQLDRIFLAHIAVDLEQQYGNYEDTGMSTQNPEVKRYIEDLLSEVKHQDQMAKEIAPENSGSSASEQ